MMPADVFEVHEALRELEVARTKPYYDEADDHARSRQYYRSITANVTGAALAQQLSDLLTQTHAPKPAYKPAVHVYPWVDLHPDRKLRSIYSQAVFEAEELILEDFRIERERFDRARERVESEGLVTPERMQEALSEMEAQLPFNCEHVVPQSWFGKREPMRGDLHHLFACEPGCNSFRGNTPYFDFSDFDETIRDACGKRDDRRFEPTAAKGAVSRATLYFLLRYPNSIGNAYDADRLLTLLDWHTTQDVDEYERHRNMAIFEKQGNRNPLIDHPEWATRIDFSRLL